MDLSPANRKKELWLIHSQATSLRKQLTFCCTTTGFPAKWHLRNEHRNSIPMMHHYPDLGSTSDWLCHVGYLLQPIKSTTQTWVVTCHVIIMSWNFCTHFSDATSYEMLPVFSSYQTTFLRGFSLVAEYLKCPLSSFKLRRAGYELVYCGINNTRPT